MMFQRNRRLHKSFHLQMAMDDQLVMKTPKNLVDYDNNNFPYLCLEKETKSRHF